MGKNRLFEIFEHLNGVSADPTPEIGNQESKWNVDEIESILIDMGQENHSFNGHLNGVSQGDFGRVKFDVGGNVLYLEFQTPEIAHMAFNSLSNNLSNPYEFSSRFDAMPNTVMVQFTDSGIDENMLAYAHVDNAEPTQDKYKLGLASADVNEASSEPAMYDKNGSPIEFDSYASLRALAPEDYERAINYMKDLQAQNKLSPIGQDLLNIHQNYQQKSSMKKAVKDLQVGEILSSGAKVISKPVAGLGTPAGQVEIGIEYPGGNRKFQIWNKNTQVTIRN